MALKMPADLESYGSCLFSIAASYERMINSLLVSIYLALVSFVFVIFVI